MPNYEYACRDCGEHLEAVQSFSDDPLTKCPSCQGQLRKVFTPVGIAFRGTGFYRNDSRKSTAKAESSKGGDKNGKSEKGDAKRSSDGVSKPADASDKKTTAAATPSSSSSSSEKKSTAAAP